VLFFIFIAIVLRVFQVHRERSLCGAIRGPGKLSGLSGFSLAPFDDIIFIFLTFGGS